MELKDYNTWPETVPQDTVNNLINELYKSDDKFRSTELFEILVELGERFSKNYTTIEISLKEKILALIKKHIDFTSIELVMMGTNIMFLFQLKNCYDYLTLEMNARPLKVDIETEISDALKEYKSTLL